MVGGEGEDGDEAEVGEVAGDCSMIGQGMRDVRAMGTTPTTEHRSRRSRSRPWLTTSLRYRRPTPRRQRCQQRHHSHPFRISRRYPLKWADGTTRWPPWTQTRHPRRMTLFVHGWTPKRDPTKVGWLKLKLERPPVASAPTADQRVILCLTGQNSRQQRRSNWRCRLRVERSYHCIAVLAAYYTITTSSIAQATQRSGKNMSS